MNDKKIFLDYDRSRIRRSIKLLSALKTIHGEKIIELLKENSEMNVTELMIGLRIEQSIVSNYLALLRRYNVVKRRRKGKYIYYSLNHSKYSEVMNLVKKMSLI